MVSEQATDREEGWTFVRFIVLVIRAIWSQDCLFTVEKLAGEGWEQTPANRFRHSEAYLRNCAEKSGFAVTEIVECALRSESNTPVEGFAVALKKA